MTVDRSLTLADLQAMIGKSAFHKLFRPQILRIDRDGPVLTVKFLMSASLERQPETNQWHGGAVAAIIDTAGCYALTTDGDDPPPTIDVRADYLRPAIDTDLTAVAKVRKKGRAVAVVDVEVNDDRDRLVAIGRASYAVSGART